MTTRMTGLRALVDCGTMFADRQISHLNAAVQHGWAERKTRIIASRGVCYVYTLTMRRDKAINMLASYAS